MTDHTRGYDARKRTLERRNARLLKHTAEPARVRISTAGHVKGVH